MAEPSTTTTSSKQKEGPLKIDPRCLSCQVTGHDISHILSLFKCACILYTPSNVTYNFKSYRRQEFLKLRKTHFKEALSLKSKESKIKVAITASSHERVAVKPSAEE